MDEDGAKDALFLFQVSKSVSTISQNDFVACVHCRPSSIDSQEVDVGIKMFNVVIATVFACGEAESRGIWAALDGYNIVQEFDLMIVMTNNPGETIAIWRILSS